jgi:mannan endo-1,4-beta-mannosidase
MSILCLLLFAPLPTIRLEAEAATLRGPHVASSRPGFSGTGYVTDITAPDARIQWRVDTKPGLYDLRLGYSCDSDKGFEMHVNGIGSSGMLPATGNRFGVRDVGKVELKAGENEISIDRGWGHYDVDYLDLKPGAKLTRVKPVSAKLADPQATPEAIAIYSKLTRSYGRLTYSGQYDKGECAYIESKTGRIPAILGGDLIDYSPTRVARENPPSKDLVPGWIESVKKGQILTLSWHWTAPTDLIDKNNYKNAQGQIENDLWYFGFYTRASTFDVKKALADPHGADYQLLLRDIDTIAVQLKRLQDAHVPVLWRPLHEADGTWFWWGAKGPEACKALYRLMFDRLTHYHRLHNLIWVWNSPSPDWYPGDDVVDVMSIDQYPSDRRDALSCEWQDEIARFNGRKPLALAEFPGAPDVVRMRKLGVDWLYFVSWTGGVGPRTTPPEVLKSTYDSKSVVSLRPLSGSAHP